MIYVRLAAPVVLENPFDAWFVSGTLRVKSVTTADGRTGYTLEQASAEPYNAEIHDQAARSSKAVEHHGHDLQSPVVHTSHQ